MMLRRFMFVILVMAYGALFVHQEQLKEHDQPRLGLPLPPAPLKGMLGYLRQLGGEMYFVKTSVFLGGLDPSKPWDAYADSLGRNFDAIAELHPDFRDTYFLAESSLAHIGPEQTRKANAILTIGIHTYPEEWLFPFFRGFNRFYYLKENRLAADDLMAASKLPNGPPWLAHLGSMLLAEGGDIYTSLAWLKTMLRGEKDEAMKARYKRDIAAFEKAWAVQTAIFAYRKKHGRMPATLDELVPEFLPGLPDLGGDFLLVWKAPLLQVQRLHTKNIAH
jgi:hypothetical protein